jgi:hypothetical protein
MFEHSELEGNPDMLTRPGMPLPGVSHTPLRYPGAIEDPTDSFRRAQLANHSSQSQHPIVMRSDAVEPSLHPDKYTDFLQRIEDTQEHIRDARETLLGSRIRLQDQRNELLQTREKAASQAGTAFTLLREHFHKIGIDLPTKLQLAFTQADVLRNTLGTKEVEYDEAEKRYNLEEWFYTEEESQFIDQLPQSAPLPSQQQMNSSLADDVDPSTRIPFVPQDIADLVAESEGELLPTAHNTNVPLYDNRIDVNMYQSTISHDVYQDLSTSRTYEGLLTYGERADPPRLLSLDDLDRGYVSSNGAGTQAWVDRRLMNVLHCSRLEKRRLRFAMQKTVQDDSAWWSLLSLYWFQDGGKVGQNRAGDTTVSEEARSEPISSSAMRQVFDTSDTTGSTKQQFSSTPLVAQDQVIDDPELLIFPTDIEPHDLVDSSSKHVKFSVEFPTTKNHLCGQSREESPCRPHSGHLSPA